MIHRRSFLSGIFSALAAPAIVRAGSLMPIKGVPLYPETGFVFSGFYSLLPLNTEHLQGVVIESYNIFLEESVPRYGGLSYQGVELSFDK